MDLVKVRVATLAVLTCWGARLGLPGTHPQSPGAGDISRAPRVRDKDVAISLGRGVSSAPPGRAGPPLLLLPFPGLPPQLPQAWQGATAKGFRSDRLLPWGFLIPEISFLCPRNGAASPWLGS